MNQTADLYSISLLNKTGITFKLITLPKAPSNADEITKLFGCKLSQVIKTLLFMGDDKPILICAPGDKKVDTNRVKQRFNLNELRMAKGFETVAITGYPIGGISPFFEHSNNLIAVLDPACLEEEKINIGAGTQFQGIEILSSDFIKVWRGLIEKITK